MADAEMIEGFGAQVSALEESLGSASVMAASFDAELSRVRAAMTGAGHDVAALEKGLSRGLRSAIDDVVLDGARLSDALSTVAESMINAAYSAAVKPVTNHMASLISSGIGAVTAGLLPFAKGGSFAGGRVQPFAAGGIVNAPTLFPMRNGTGLMGEAGPEAIMPLTRGADGKLGVRAAGAGSAPVTVVMNVNTPDVQGFQRSQGQIAAQLGRVIGRGARNR